MPQDRSEHKQKLLASTRLVSSHLHRHVSRHELQLKTNSVTHNGTTDTSPVSRSALWLWNPSEHSNLGTDDDVNDTTHPTPSPSPASSSPATPCLPHRVEIGETSPPRLHTEHERGCLGLQSYWVGELHPADPSHRQCQATAAQGCLWLSSISWTLNVRHPSLML